MRAGWTGAGLGRTAGSLGVCLKCCLDVDRSREEDQRSNAHEGVWAGRPTSCVHTKHECDGLQLIPALSSMQGPASGAGGVPAPGLALGTVFTPAGPRRRGGPASSAWCRTHRFHRPPPPTTSSSCCPLPRAQGQGPATSTLRYTGRAGARRRSSTPPAAPAQRPLTRRRPAAVGQGAAGRGGRGRGVRRRSGSRAQGCSASQALGLGAGVS
jgi:hypothetical protein